MYSLNRRRSILPKRPITVVGRIAPSSSRPFMNGTPARAATSPSPVVSMTTLATIA